MSSSCEAWDAAAASFDDEPDHGLRDPQTRRAWKDLLSAWLPAPKADVLDTGCGTGSLSLLMAELGHTVSGIDFSEPMIAQAREKAQASGRSISFCRMDAAQPALKSASFDALVCRHLLWVFPDPGLILQRWSELLKPGGRMLLIEGYWSTEAGLRAEDVVSALPSSLAVLVVKNLSDNPEYWGKQVGDERYLLVAEQL